MAERVGDPARGDGARGTDRRGVLLVTNIFPPQIGGPASFIDRLAHALAAAGRRVTVVCGSDRPAEPSDAARPFVVRRVVRGGRVAFEANARAALCLEMARHRAVLVNGLEHQAAHAASIVRRRYVLKIVGDTVWESARNAGLTASSIDDFQREPPPAEVRLLADRRRRYLDRASLVITPSEYLRRMVIGWGMAPDRVRTVLNGVEPLPGASPRRRDGGLLRVLFVGRLTNWKGVETLLLALRELECVRASIVGDGPELPMLAALAEQCALGDRVHFLGRRSPAETQAAMRTHDVLVLGSSYEGLSHTLLEASAAGLACVATDSGGNPEVVDGSTTGLLYPYGDVARLATALRTLRDDEERRVALAHGALENSRRFSFDETVRGTISVLAEHGRPR
jgi:glycosyltransferase involved in cell wall biosynthesis